MREKKEEDRIDFEIKTLGGKTYVVNLSNQSSKSPYYQILDAMAEQEAIDKKFIKVSMLIDTQKMSGEPCLPKTMSCEDLFKRVRAGNYSHFIFFIRIDSVLINMMRAAFALAQANQSRFPNVIQQLPVEICVFTIASMATFLKPEDALKQATEVWADVSQQIESLPSRQDPVSPEQIYELYIKLNHITKSDPYHDVNAVQTYLTTIFSIASKADQYETFLKGGGDYYFSDSRIRKCAINFLKQNKQLVANTEFSLQQKRDIRNDLDAYLVKLIDSSCSLSQTLKKHEEAADFIDQLKNALEPLKSKAYGSLSMFISQNKLTEEETDSTKKLIASIKTTILKKKPVESVDKMELDYAPSFSTQDAETLLSNNTLRGIIGKFQAIFKTILDGSVAEKIQFTES